MNNKYGYGIGDNSFQAAGELAGVTKLVDDFYSNMNTFSQAEKIRNMHPEDLTESRRKLTYFLCGWLGGPRLFAEHYGPINIPKFHQHLDIHYSERDAWLLCMEKAINSQPYEQTFKEYLLEQLKIPAEKIREISSDK